VAALDRRAERERGCLGAAADGSYRTRKGEKKRRENMRSPRRSCLADPEEGREPSLPVRLREKRRKEEGPGDGLLPANRRATRVRGVLRREGREDGRRSAPRCCGTSRTQEKKKDGVPSWVSRSTWSKKGEEEEKRGERRPMCGPV